jgi:hypothetical protein
MVVDGQLGPAFGGVGNLVFSADGQHMAYTTIKGKKWIVVVDGQPSAEYDFTLWRDLAIENLTFSADGRHLVYVVQNSSTKDFIISVKITCWAYVVADNQRGPTFGVICAGPVFRSDGRLEYLGWGQIPGTKKDVVCRVTWP